MSSKADIKRIDAILAAIQKKMIALYGQTYQKAVQITQVREAIAAGKTFKWMDDPAAERQFQQMLDKLTRNVELLTTSGCNVGAQTGAGAGLAVIAKANKHDLDQEDAKQQREQMAESLIDTHTNTAGKKGFTSLTLDNGADRLSDRVWKLNQGAKQEMEIIIQNGIKQGKTADEIAKSVQGYLVNPTALYRRVRNKETGKLELSEAAKNYHPGQGVYRSAYQNAMRLARTEVNAAYMRAESAAYAKDPLVTAIKIQRSQNHTTKLPNGDVVPLHDICDELEGVYPKDFIFTLWHPNCYSADTQVLTNMGWKQFKDVQPWELILSLNPETMSVEWVGIADRQEYNYQGPMYHFHNKSLDMLVTPDHNMVYIAQHDNKIHNKPAKEFKPTQGVIYRSSKYNQSDHKPITIGSRTYPFDLWCEFMAYWLADGSLIRNSQIVISQQANQGAYDDIIKCIAAMGLEVHATADNININDRALCEELKSYGHATDKHVPQSIRNASPRQMRIFLDAYCKCDGYRRKPHAYVGSKGTICQPKNEEIMYFTTSKLMAADLCELIIKIGKRPSIYEQEPHDATKKDGKVIHSRHVCYRISELNSQTASMYQKTEQHYDGMVYDLTLERNHIMYVMRNGKPCWGSNCRCYITPILRTPAQAKKGVNQPKTELPANFKNWVSANQPRLMTARTVPYFVRNNARKIAQQIPHLEDDTLDLLNQQPGNSLVETPEQQNGDKAQNKPKQIPQQLPQDMPGDITGSQFQKRAMTTEDIQQLQINRRIQARMKAAELDKVKEKDIRQDMWQTFQQLKKDIDKYDNSNGYLDIAHKVEEAYNILQISRDKDLAKVPSDQLSTKMPYELIKLSKHDQLPDVRIFNALNKYVPTITNANGTYYDDESTKLVFVSRTEERRMKTSKWFDKTMPTHEYAHAIYDQRADVQAEAERAWELVRDEIWKPGIVETIKESIKKAQLMEDYDEEKWKALTDLIQAADPEHNPIPPGGHDKGYFAKNDNVESEFIAHCSECLTAGNDVIKQHFPDVYKVMQEVMRSIIQRKNGSARRV